MQIRQDKNAGTVLFVPSNRGECRTMTNILGVLAGSKTRQLRYSSRIGDANNPFKKLVFYAGGRRKRVSRKYKGHVGSTRSITIGGVRLLLTGTTEKDKSAVGGVRDACFWGRNGGLFLVRSLRGGAALFTAGRCKHCQSPMIDRGSCEWATCGRCALVCDHAYVKGAVHGGGVDIGVSEFCDKCGRGKPREPTHVPLGQELSDMAVYNELGIQVCRTDGTPAEMAKIVDVLHREEGR